MKTLFRRSCLGLLLILLVGGLIAVSVFAIVFQQSQAQLSAVHDMPTSTLFLSVSSTIAPTYTINPSSINLTDSNAGVTIQVDMPTATLLPTDTPIVPTVTDVSIGASTTTPSDGSAQAVTPTDLPRYSGTSSYPMTVTAEVILGQTHVAGYEAGVNATRTAIAAESASIFATLTAAALPTGTP